MPRDRLMPSDFWTWEAVIDCAPMTRLLFIGLWNFADDFGVQPLRPRTLRMQVFPGDAIDNEAVRTMVGELAAQGLVRLYAVDGVDYVAIVDGDRLQRVGKRARRRYPPDPAAVPVILEAREQAPSAIANHRSVETPRDCTLGGGLERPSPTIATHSNTETPTCPPVGEASDQPSPIIVNHNNVETPSEPPPPGAMPVAATCARLIAL
jgi:hypothetical protein